MREAAVDAHFTQPVSAFLPALAICFFLRLFLAPLMRVLVKFKVKAYTGLHNDLYLDTSRICQRL